MGRIAALGCCLWLLSTPALAQEGGGWYSLQVPGGDVTLRSLGVADEQPRATVMIELIRRLHFSTQTSVSLQNAIKSIPPASGAVTLPLPLPPAVWEQQIFGRAVPATRLFQEILSDPSARLLYHGLAGLDVETRKWIEGQPDLLRALYRNAEAAKSFALFAPAIRVTNGKVVVPGGAAAEAQWTDVLGARSDRPDAFVSRLFLDREGRAAGLYFLIAFVEPPRQKFLLSGGQFKHLVSSFSSCYPRQSNDYPFVLRSKDPAWLLQFINLSENGELAGPRSRAVWEGVFGDNSMTAPYGLKSDGPIDAAWMVDRLCAASTVDRNAVLATLLVGQRLFVKPQAVQDPAIVVALRVRRLFPSLFMVMERAGIQDPAAFGYIGRLAQRLDRLNNLQDAPIALQQFQGALSIVLRARVAGTITEQDARRLFGLPEMPIGKERYEGRVAEWIERELLPVFRKATASPAEASAEDVVARALAGPGTSPVVSWEGIDYQLDYAATTRERLRGVREKQGGDTLDHALALKHAAADPAAIHAADTVLAQVLSSWAYAPNVGTPDSGALLGGDASRRHDLGIRQVNRTRFEQRWEPAIAPGDRGSIAGSYLGLEATLAGWSMRRLASDTIPHEPTLGDNDRASLAAAVSLSEPRRMTDAAMRRISAAIADGSKQLDAAGSHSTRLEELAERAALSPWTRASLAWTAVNDPGRIAGQFSLVARASLGGLHLQEMSDWGTSAVPLGCLCLMPPSTRIPELVVGRPVDGIVGAHSADLMFRIASLLTELKMPAQLAPAVLVYAMRDYIDAIQPLHPADVDAFARQATRLTRTAVEDYIGAIAAVGPLRPVKQ